MSMETQLNLLVEKLQLLQPSILTTPTILIMSANFASMVAQSAQMLILALPAMSLTD
jgi:hypothetical protein